MNLIEDDWLQGTDAEGKTAALSLLDIGDVKWLDLHAERPDFRGALYQLLIGVLQTGYAPQDVDEWRDRWRSPPDRDELSKAFNDLLPAFVLESDSGAPAFMQDLELPAEANQLSVRDLLIDAGSDSNLYFNKPVDDFCLCGRCAATALFALQINAPSGGRGVRTSLRGGGPLTTLLLPVESGTPATLWQKLWLNVQPVEALSHAPVTELGRVLPWLLPTRNSDGDKGLETTPQSVHPLQAYWSMPRRIRLVSPLGDGGVGTCSVCAAENVRVFSHYKTRHGGTNYTGAWTHPLTPYKLDSKGEKPPISCKGRDAGKGYREWVGLVLGNEDHQPDAAQVVRHFNNHVRKPAARLWCFGYAMDNMKAQCWYESMLPVLNVEASRRRVFTKRVKELLDAADLMAIQLHKHVKSAWFSRPGDVGQERAVPQSFWQGSEPMFYRALHGLHGVDDLESASSVRPVYQQWLREARELVLGLFDDWVLKVPVEALNMQRVVQARADLLKDLSAGKAFKPLWDVVSGGKKASEMKKANAREST